MMKTEKIQSWGYSVASDETRFTRGIPNKDLINTFGDYTEDFPKRQI